MERLVETTREYERERERNCKLKDAFYSEDVSIILPKEWQHSKL